MRSTIRNAALSTLTIICLVGSFAAGASATLPGKNGPLLANEFPGDSEQPKIASRFQNVVLINPDGSGRRQLYTTNSPFNGARFLTPGGLAIAENPADNFSIDPKNLDIQPFPGVVVGGNDRVDGISPDGQTLIRTYFQTSCPGCEPAPNQGIWTRDLSSGKAERLEIDTDLIPMEAVYTPDGKRLVIAALPNDGVSSESTILTARADGSDLRKVASFPFVNGLTVSPDGRRVAFRSTTFSDDPTSSDPTRIRVIGLGGSGNRVLRTDLYAYGPVFSPDGRKIAFNRHAPYGEDAIWVMNADGSGAKPVESGEAVFTVADWGRAETFRVKRFDRAGSELLVRTWNPGKVSVRGALISASSVKSGPGVVRVPVGPRSNIRLPRGTRSSVTVTFKPKGALKSVQKKTIRLG